MERYILPYDNYDENNKIIGFCVAHNKEECLIDEDDFNRTRCQNIY